MKISSKEGVAIEAVNDLVPVLKELSFADSVSISGTQGDIRLLFDSEEHGALPKVDFDRSSGPIQANKQFITLRETLLEVAREMNEASRSLPGPMQVVGVKQILSNPYFLRADYLVRNTQKPESEPFVYRNIRWSDRLDNGVAVVATNKAEEILLTRELNFAIRKFTWRVPVGARNPDESTNQTAARVLLAEGNVQPSDSSKFTELGFTSPDPNIVFDGSKNILVDNVEQLESAPNIAVSQAFESREFFTMPEIKELVQNGELLDGFSQGALLQYMLSRTAV